jgi:hypothetical protein
VVLAVRAKAMAAGMRNDSLVIAAFALELHHRAGRAAAMANSPERPKLLEAQPVAKLPHEVSFELGDDSSEADHRGVPLARQ